MAFDLTEAKLTVADTDGVAGVSAADLRAGDVVLVQARLPRGGEAPATIAARKRRIDVTHPPASEAQEAEPAEPTEAPAG